MNTLPDESPRDFVDRRVAQLDSLTSFLAGGGGEAFRLYNHDIQSDVLWLIADLAHDVRFGLDALAKGASR